MTLDPRHDLFKDPPELREDGFERVAMNAGNTVDLLDPPTSVFLHAVAGGVPI